MPPIDTRTSRQATSGSSRTWRRRTWTRPPRARAHELVHDADGPPHGRADGRARDAHLRERPEPEDQARVEHDVDGVGEPQRAHGHGRVARPAEDRVDQEEEQDRRVAAEHPGGVRPARLDDRRRRAHERQQLARPHDARRPRWGADTATPTAIACTAVARRLLGLFSPIRRATSAVVDMDSPMASREHHGQERLREAHGRHRVGTQAPDEEDVEDPEDRLHEHLEDHGHGEQEHRLAQASLGVVLLRAPDRLLEQRPQGRLRLGRRGTLVTVVIGSPLFSPQMKRAFRGLHPRRPSTTIEFWPDLGCGGLRGGEGGMGELMAIFIGGSATATDYRPFEPACPGVGSEVGLHLGRRPGTLYAKLRRTFYEKTGGLAVQPIARRSCWYTW